LLKRRRIHVESYRTTSYQPLHSRINKILAKSDADSARAIARMLSCKHAGQHVSLKLKYGLNDKR